MQVLKQIVMPPERGKRRAKACRQAQRPTVADLTARDRIVSQAACLVASVAAVATTWVAVCAACDALMGVI